MTRSARTIFVIFLLIQSTCLFGSEVSVKSYANLLFQKDPSSAEIISNFGEFRNDIPVHFQVNATSLEYYLLQLPLESGNSIFINNRLYKFSEYQGLYRIPMKNLVAFSKSKEFLVSIAGKLSPDNFSKIQLVIPKPVSLNQSGSLRYDNVVQLIPPSIKARNYFNQFGFVTLLMVTVFFSQSLFARKTVFVGAAAVRQSRYRSMDDNLKLFGFNVLLFSFLFSGFSFNKLGLDDFVILVFFKNLLLVSLFFGLKIFLNASSKKIFFDSNALSFYANNYLHITALFGIVLASFFYLEAFVSYPIPEIPIGIYLAFFMLAELAYVVSFAFMNYELSRYKLFYIISYICAFEGIPLLILAKYLFQNGIISS